MSPSGGCRHSRRSCDTTTATATTAPSAGVVGETPAGGQQVEIAVDGVPQVTLRVNAGAAVGGAPVALPVTGFDPLRMGEARRQLLHQLFVDLGLRRCWEAERLGVAPIKGVQRDGVGSVDCAGSLPLRRATYAVTPPWPLSTLSKPSTKPSVH